MCFECDSSRGFVLSQTAMEAGVFWAVAGGIGALVRQFVGRFTTGRRYEIFLTGGDAPVLKRDVIQRAREAFGIDATPFEKLLDVREGRLKPRDLDPVPLLASYLKEISQVIDAVDRIERLGELS